MNVDTWAGVAAIGWALLALLVVSDLNQLVDFKMAFGFGVLALGRALKSSQKKDSEG